MWYYKNISSRGPLSMTNTLFNSLWPSDAIYMWHRSGSTLAQVMASCLTAPSHYLDRWSVLTYHQWGLVAFTWGQFHRKYSRYLSLIWVCKLLILYYSLISQGPMSSIKKRWQNSISISIMLAVSPTAALDRKLKFDTIKVQDWKTPGWTTDKKHHQMDRWSNVEMQWINVHFSITYNYSVYKLRLKWTSFGHQTNNLFVTLTHLNKF